MITTLDKELNLGFVASYGVKGWLWLSKLTAMHYCGNCNLATVEYDDELNRLEIYPFRPVGLFSMQRGWLRIEPIQDNGVGINISEFLPIASKLKLFGQYFPNYDAEKHLIWLDMNAKLKRSKKHGR